MSTKIINLQEWLARTQPPSKDGLMGLVLGAVESVEWPKKEEMFGLDAVEDYPAKLLMVLEVFCYARGIYESGDVEFYARRNKELLALFKGRIPEGRLIRLFRRRNREPIRQCLEWIFDVALRVRFGGPDGEETPIDYCVARAIDHWFEPICGPQPSVEADERIDQAIFWDGMAASA
jgi:hypothetical protein